MSANMADNPIIKTFRFCTKCQADTERQTNGKCKPCEKASSAVRYAANPEKAKARAAAWYAANREKARASQAAWHVANRDRENADSAAWAKANPEATRIHHSNRRARKRAAGGKLSKDLSIKLFELQRGKCACCKQPLGNDYHLDHIMPLALGGLNIDANTQLLRQRCNAQKHAKHPVEFMQSRGFLV